jgi:hypothetical protein
MNHASVDASETIKKFYQAYLRGQQLSKWMHGHKAFTEYVQNELGEKYVQPLRELKVDNWQLFKCIQLLKVKTFRSNLRKSLAEQLNRWLFEPDNRKYESPFSIKQWEIVCTSYKRESEPYFLGRIFRNPPTKEDCDVEYA